MRSLSCREIAAEIELSLAFLTAPLRNLPERHRSLRVVFGETWAVAIASRTERHAKVVRFSRWLYAARRLNE